MREIKEEEEGLEKESRIKEREDKICEREAEKRRHGLKKKEAKIELNRKRKKGR